MLCKVLFSCNVGFSGLLFIFFCQTVTSESLLRPIMSADEVSGIGILPKFLLGRFFFSFFFIAVKEQE